MPCSQVPTQIFSYCRFPYCNREWNGSGGSERGQHTQYKLLTNRTSCSVVSLISSWVWGIGMSGNEANTHAGCCLQTCSNLLQTQRGHCCELCIESSIIVNTIVMHVDLLVVLVCIHIHHLSLPGREAPSKEKGKKMESFEFMTLYSTVLQTTCMSMSLLITHLVDFWGY